MSSFTIFSTYYVGKEWFDGCGSINHVFWMTVQGLDNRSVPRVYEVLSYYTDTQETLNPWCSRSYREWIRSDSGPSRDFHSVEVMIRHLDPFFSHSAFPVSSVYYGGERKYFLGKNLIIYCVEVTSDGTFISFHSFSLICTKS